MLGNMPAFPQSQPHGNSLGLGTGGFAHPPLFGPPIQKKPRCTLDAQKGLLQDKLTVNCDCTCNYEQTDTFLLGMDSKTKGCDLAQMEEINRLRAAAGFRRR